MNFKERAFKAAYDGIRNRTYTLQRTLDVNTPEPWAIAVTAPETPDQLALILFENGIGKVNTSEIDTPLYAKCIELLQRKPTTATIIRNPDVVRLRADKIIEQYKQRVKQRRAQRG